MRVPRIDALRGLAVFGILFVNIWGFVYGYGLSTYPAEGGVLGPSDAAAIFFTAAFGEQKFYPIFSFLFGAGFALQTGRAQAPGPARTGIEHTYRRRLRWLLACGLIHATMLWFGDILVAYALTGFWLASKIGQRLSQLVRSFRVLAIVNLVLLAVIGLMHWLDTRLPLEELATRLQSLRSAHAVYTQGSWLDIAGQRLADYFGTAVGYLIILPRLALLFMLGVLAVRCGWLTHPERHRHKWRRIALAGIGIGLPLNLWWGLVAVNSTFDPAVVLPVTALGRTVMEVAGPLLAAGYVALFMLAGPTVARILEPVGRMALTNYLLQSVLLMLIVQGAGLGLGATLSRTGLMGVATAVMLAQLAFSHWWLLRHTQGPMEALWRRYTYRGRSEP